MGLGQGGRVLFRGGVELVGLDGVQGSSPGWMEI